MNCCHFPDFFFLYLSRQEREVRFQSLHLAFFTTRALIPQVKELVWNITTEYIYFNYTFRDRKMTTGWALGATGHAMSRPGWEYHLLLGCHMLQLHRGSLWVSVLSQILCSWKIWIFPFPCCKWLKTTLGIIGETLLYTWCSVLGFFLPKNWLPFQSMDCRYKNRLLSKSWARDHDFCWVATPSLLIIQS